MIIWCSKEEQNERKRELQFTTMTLTTSIMWVRPHITISLIQNEKITNEGQWNTELSCVTHLPIFEDCYHLYSGILSYHIIAHHLLSQIIEKLIYECADSGLGLLLHVLFGTTPTIVFSVIEWRCIICCVINLSSQSVRYNTICDTTATASSSLCCLACQTTKTKQIASLNSFPLPSQNNSPTFDHHHTYLLLCYWWLALTMTTYIGYNFFISLAFACVAFPAALGIGKFAGLKSVTPSTHSPSFQSWVICYDGLHRWLVLMVSSQRPQA